METNELKNIWKTLANEKLIDKELAEENIERIIALKSSKTVEKLSNKLRIDFLTNIGTSLLIIAITIFAYVFLHQRNHSLPIQGYIFLFLNIAYFASKALIIYLKSRLLKLSFTTFTIKDSLKKVKKEFEKTSKKEEIIFYIAFMVIVIYANILLNKNTDFTNFKINSLQGYVLIFSIVSLLLGPFINKFLFRKRFSGIITDINSSLEELEEL